MRWRRSAPRGRRKATVLGWPYFLLLWTVSPVIFLPDAAEARQVQSVVSFDADIDVQANGWLEVTEQIRFVGSPKGTKGRLRRDLPVGPPRPGGFGRLTAPLKFVNRDRHTQLEVHSAGGPPGTSGIRIWLGTPGRSISPGDNTYGFSYRTTRWLAFDGDRTRLTWEVIRNPWSVPIRSVTARVHLPGHVEEGAVVLDGWTGPERAHGSPLRSIFDADARLGSSATFSTSGPLHPDKAVTIQLDFPAGLVSPPTPAQEAAWARLDRKQYTDMVWIVFLVIAFFVLVWVEAGRDPPAPPVVVKYDPPEGVSPSAIGYLDRRGYDRRLLTAAIVSLARKGVLEIEETSRRKWTVRRIGPISRALTPDERAVAEKLLPEDDALVITGISHRRFREASRALRKELKRRFRGRYFVSSRGWFSLGLLLSVAGFVHLVSRTRFGLLPSAWVPVAVLLIFGIPFGLALRRGYARWRIDLAEMSPKPGPLAASVWPLVMTIPLGFLASTAHQVYEAVPPHLFLAALILCGVNAVFFQLLERPTVAGQELLSHVEGFKRFLTATEEDRLGRLSTKESQELYERLLPYAVALGLKNRWATIFGYAVNPVQDEGAGAMP